MRSVSAGLLSMVRSYLGVWPTMFAVNSLLERMWNSKVASEPTGRVGQLAVPPLWVM